MSNRMSSNENPSFLTKEGRKNGSKRRKNKKSNHTASDRIERTLSRHKKADVSRQRHQQSYLNIEDEFDVFDDSDDEFVRIDSYSK